MLTRLPVLSAQTKVGNSSYKLKKKKIRKVFINAIKSPKYFATI